MKKIILFSEIKDFIKCPHFYGYMKKEGRYEHNPKTDKSIIVLSFALSIAIFIYGLLGVIKLIRGIFI